MNLISLNEKLSEYSKKKTLRYDDKEHIGKLCIEFARRLTRLKKKYFNEEDFEELSQIVAEECYILIVSDKYQFNSLLAYANAAYMGWVENWLKMNGSSLYKIDENKLAKFFNPGIIQRYENSDIDVIVDKLCTRDMLMELFLDLRTHGRRITMWTNKNAMLNARVSLMLSIERKHYVNYKLTGIDEVKCRLLYNKYKLACIKVIESSIQPKLSDVDYVNALAGDIFQMNGVWDDED